MKRLFFVTAIALLLATPAQAQRGHRSGGTVHVRASVRRDGTPVKAHERTAPNNTIKDNWSTKGNTNPYTGKPGTVDPNKKP